MHAVRLELALIVTRTSKSRCMRIFATNRPLPLPCLPAPCLCPGLVSLDLSDNRLTGVPPAVAAASNLTELSLQRNPRMAVDEAGIGLLLGLPRLRRLYLRGDCAPPHVLARLSQSAPQLQVSPDEAWELE